MTWAGTEIAPLVIPGLVPGIHVFWPYRFRRMMPAPQKQIGKI